MKFVSEHLTFHHMKRKPHRWFAAFVLSPIHAAEMHYKKRYHLTFVHAKKLFFFDIFLIFAIILLGALTYFWFTFDPTVTQHISLSITSQTHDPDNTDNRIRSGEHIAYAIEYTNDSEVTLTDAELIIRLPEGFEVEEGLRRIPIGTLEPGETGSASLSGFFYEPVECVHHIVVVLTYMQDGRRFEEQKIATIIQTLRGSIVEGSMNAPGTILTTGSYPISVSLTNDNHHTIHALGLPLPSEGELRVVDGAGSRGTIVDNTWEITDLTPGETVTFTGTLIANITTPGATREFTLTPQLLVEGRSLAQVPLTQEIFVLRPEASVSAAWSNSTPIQPGDQAKLTIAVKNSGTTDLQNVGIQFDIPNEVEASLLPKLNSGSLAGGTFVIPNAIGFLSVGETKEATITIPTKARNGSGTDAALLIFPEAVANVPNLGQTKYISPAGSSEPLAIGTMLFLLAESRYYTPEGDQLGRGPLPATVGDETKYWAFISIQNTTSRVNNLNFTATLPSWIQWTDRSSVSHGQDLSYNSSSRTVSWNLHSLQPHDTAGLFMELSITPNPGQIGTSPIILQDMTITGTDGYIDEDITRVHSSIDISLPRDDIGKAKGTVVQ